jgi:hypothetical protein
LPRVAAVHKKCARSCLTRSPEGRSGPESCGLTDSVYLPSTSAGRWPDGIRGCWRRPSFDQPRRSKIDQGAEAVLMTAVCG